MVSRVEIKKRLMREFSFYQKDLDYFENLLLQKKLKKSMKISPLI